MSEQTKNIIISAVSKFFSDFWYGNWHDRIKPEQPSIAQLASILYLMKKGYISVHPNISDDTKGKVISFELLRFLKEYNKSIYEEWSPLGVSNISAIVDCPEGDPFAEDIFTHLSMFEKNLSAPSFLFEFLKLISDHHDGDSYYLQVFDIALSIFLSKNNVSQFSQPEEFSELASALVDAKGKDIYNPFSGLMSFASSMKDYNSFTGVELNPIISFVCRIRISLAESQDKLHCIQGDACEWTGHSYDVVVSNPPLGMPLEMKGEPRPIRSEWFCLKSFEKLTNDNGVLFTYVIPSVLFDSRLGKDIRREITEKNYLDTVILLPANLLRPYTSISLVAVLLKKDRAKDAPIKMLDATAFNKGDKKNPILDVEAVVNCLDNPDTGKCVCVTQEDIRRENYNWSVNAYLNSFRDSFPEGYEVVSLGDVVELIRGERRFDEKSGHLAQIAELSSETEDCIRTVDSFGLTDNLSNTSKITEPVILLSSIRVLKPTYCEASPDNPLFVHPNVWACKITKDWVSPHYLCLEISRRFVFSGGNIIPRISRSDLLGMRIAFPSVGQQRSLDEQNNLYKEAANNAKLAKAKEMGLQNLIESMKSEYINTIRTRKHDMMPYVREMGSVSRSIRGYVDKYGSPELQTKMANLLTQFDEAYKGLSALIDVFSQENEFGNPESVNIDLYLRNLAKKYEDRQKHFIIGYYCDDNALEAYGLPVHGKKKKFSMSNSFFSFEAEFSKSNEAAKLFVEIAPLDLDRVVHNIVDNAVQHGFVDPEENDYRIDITLTVVPERDMFQIDFSNNGTPLPLGVDKISYGLLGEKAGITGKTGQGGYIVKSIVEHYKGDYDIFMDGENTVVRILLPISKNNG